MKTALIIAAAVGISCSASTQAAPGRSEDITRLYTKILMTHPSPYRKTSASEWEQAYQSLLADTNTLSDEEFLVRMSRFAALAGDGHTNLVPFFAAPDSFPGRLPVRFHLFEEGIFVIRSSPEHKEIAGGRVLAVNGHPVEKVVTALGSLIGRDNDQWAKRWIPTLLTYPDYVEGLGLGAGNRSAPQKFSIRLRNGRTVTAELKPEKGKVEWTEARKTPEPLVPAELAYGFRHLPEQDAVYAVYREVADSEKETVAEFAKRLFAFIESRNIGKLVFDIRDNGGGNNYLNQPILHGMIRSRLNRPGGIYILTGRRTFSAAMNLATRVERHTQALFVGEPTGGAPNHFGDPVLETLPFSKLPYLVSTLFWQDSQPGDPRVWIFPDIPVPERFTDWVTGRDAALVAALTHVPDANEAVMSPISRWRRPSQRGVWPPSD